MQRSAPRYLRLSASSLHCSITDMSGRQHARGSSQIQDRGRAQDRIGGPAGCTGRITWNWACAAKMNTRRQLLPGGPVACEVRHVPSLAIATDSLVARATGTFTTTQKLHDDTCTSLEQQLRWKIHVLHAAATTPCPCTAGCIPTAAQHARTVCSGKNSPCRTGRCRFKLL
jgi:hypothetical protein